MRGIFFRHVLRSIFSSTLAVGLLLLAVLFAYQLSFVLRRAAEGQLPGALVLELVALTLRGNLTIILPFAVVLGVVMGLGRHYHDSEITAAHAGGIRLRTLYGAAAAVILAAAGLAAWIALVDGPAAARRVMQLRTDALRTAITRGLTPGQFRSLGSGTTLYFRAAEADGTLRDVFLQRDLPETQGRASRMQVVLAARADYAVSADGNHYTIDLVDGRSYEGAPGDGAWRITQFGKQSIRVPTPQARLPGRPRLDQLATGELLRAADGILRAELHWRIGWVVNVIVLGLLAVPLARLRPGQGRHARLPWAVLLFAVYAGLLTTGRLMLERGDMPAVLGLWWVHAVIVALGVVGLQSPRWSATLRRKIRYRTT
jgi:lipopolysaccharide export system permease protein